MAILFTGRVFDAAVQAVARWWGKTGRMNSGATGKNWHSWGIKLSRGKFNAPEEILERISSWGLGAKNQTFLEAVELKQIDYSFHGIAAMRGAANYLPLSAILANIAMRDPTGSCKACGLQFRDVDDSLGAS